MSTDKFPDELLENGIYTRANRLLYRYESGYGVVAASPGINGNKEAQSYIQPIGETVEVTNGGWLYLILPSVDGRLSISKTIMTQDGTRSCNLTHCCLLSEEQTVQYLKNEPFHAFPVNIPEFNEKHVNNPTELDLMRVNLSKKYDYNPESIRLSDIGFTKNDMRSLIAAIFTAYSEENSRLRRVFVVMHCAADRFESQAKKLAALLYSVLPYCVTSAIGVAIKSDNRWKSILTGYTSLYTGNSTYPEYIPGCKVYILNEQPADTSQSVVFDVNEKKVEASGNVQPDDASAEYIDLLSEQLDHPEFKMVKAFTNFMVKFVKQNPSLNELFAFYDFFQYLYDMKESGNLNGGKIRMHIRIMMLCFNNIIENNQTHFPVFEKMVNYALRLLKRAASLRDDKAMGEALALEVFEMCLAFKFDVAENPNRADFVSNFYEIMTNYNLTGLKNEKLFNKLDENRGFFTALVEQDADKLALFDACRTLVEQATRHNIIDMLNITDSYCEDKNFRESLYTTAKRFSDDIGLVEAIKNEKKRNKAINRFQNYSFVINLEKNNYDECYNTFEKYFVAINQLYNETKDRFELWHLQLLIYCYIKNKNNPIFSKGIVDDLIEIVGSDRVNEGILTYIKDAVQANEQLKTVIFDILRYCDYKSAAVDGKLRIDWAYLLEDALPDVQKAEPDKKIAKTVNVLNEERGSISREPSALPFFDDRFDNNEDNEKIKKSELLTKRLKMFFEIARSINKSPDVYIDINEIYQLLAAQIEKEEICPDYSYGRFHNDSISRIDAVDLAISKLCGIKRRDIDETFFCAKCCTISEKVFSEKKAKCSNCKRTIEEEKDASGKGRYAMIVRMRQSTFKDCAAAASGKKRLLAILDRGDAKIDYQIKDLHGIKVIIADCPDDKTAQQFLSREFVNTCFVITSSNDVDRIAQSDIDWFNRSHPDQMKYYFLYKKDNTEYMEMKRTSLPGIGGGSDFLTACALFKALGV
jgi:hypothetical protein